MNNDRVYYSHDAKAQARRVIVALTMFVLTLGVGIGAMLALLFAPNSGKQVRHELAQSLGDDWKNGRKAVDPMIKQLGDKFAEMVKKG